MRESQCWYQKRSHGDELTDFYNKKVPKLDFHTTLAIITVHSALKKNDNYCRQLFLKKCKYVEKKVVRHVHDNLSDFYSYDESDEQ